MVAKKTTTKKPVKKTTKKVTRKAPAAKSAARMRSFRVYKDTKPFTSFKVTRQTLYWTILLIFIIITQLWILKIQLDIANLTTVILSN